MRARAPAVPGCKKNLMPINEKYTDLSLKKVIYFKKNLLSRMACNYAFFSYICAVNVHYKQTDDMKKIILTTVMMVLALSLYAQTGAYAYILDNSGTPTNVRNAPKGKVVQQLPDVDGGYEVELLEVKNNWWKIAPAVEVYGDEERVVNLKGSKTGYWIHNSVLQFNISGDPENVLRATPSPKGKFLKIDVAHLLETGLRPLEIRGEWIKVETTDKRYTGWMPIDRICSNPLTTCP